MNMIQERMKNKALDAFTEVEVQIDMFCDKGKSDFSMYKYLRQLDYSGKVIGYLRGELAQQILEVKNEEGCEQLEEAYSFMNKTTKKRFVKWLESIEKDIDKYVDEYKPVRKPPKPKTPKQLVSKLPYLKQWGKYKSIDPEAIIRAKMLYTYNTSTQKLTKFESYGGLKVRGSNIIDFDNCTEKTLTDEKLLDRIYKGGNIIARGFMDEIPRSKEKDGNPRITKNILLIKVIT